jgi:hypothetical protein
MKGKKAPTIKKATVAGAKKGGKSPFEVKAAPDDLKPEGATGKRRIDRPGRKLGGRVGADTAPLSSANKTKSRAY